MPSVQSITNRSKILIVDDHPLFREGLIEYLEKQTDWVCCGEASDAPSAMRALAAQKPDLAIIDISLKNSSGIELTKNIKTQYPDLPILILSLQEEGVYAGIALRAGANGYLTKQEAPEKVLQAIRQLLAGGIYLSEAVTHRILRQQMNGQERRLGAPVANLSDREWEVFRLLGEWKGTREIAGQLGLSIKTVEFYRERVKDKLKLGNSMELLQAATHWTQEPAVQPAPASEGVGKSRTANHASSKKGSLTCLVAER
jgi:DNA-binding NarL/FixJ family response regulator